MSTKKQKLTNPKKLRDGVMVSDIEIDYVYFHDKMITIYTKQGLVVSMRYNTARKTLLASLETDLKAKVDVPGEDVPPPGPEPVEEVPVIP